MQFLSSATEYCGTKAARNGCVCADSNGTKSDVAAWNWEGFAAWMQRQLWCPELTFGPVPPTFSTLAERDILRALLAYITGAVNTWTVGAYSKFIQALIVFFSSFYKPLTRAINRTRNIRNERCTWRPHQKTEKPFHWKGNTVKAWLEKAAWFQKTHLAYYSWCFMSACPTTEII